MEIIYNLCLRGDARQQYEPLDEDVSSLDEVKHNFQIDGI